MNRPVALTIAGSDSGGGAGIQADLRAFWALDAFGTCAVTCVTAQNLDGVLRIDPLPAAAVREQMKAVSRGFEVRALKTGMLYSREIVDSVVAEYDKAFTDRPLVVDPVMVATSGARLLRDDAVVAYAELFRRATVITPNLDELAVLVGSRPSSPAEMQDAAEELNRRFGCAVLAKGGHLEGDPVDVLVTRGGGKRWRNERIDRVHSHGSGCSLASAIAAGLARGKSLVDSVTAAKAWLDEALREAATIHSRSGEVRVIDGNPRQKQGQETGGGAEE